MATQNQDRLRTHFASAPDNTHAARWDDLWKEGTFIPWDRGYANPALIDLLSHRTSPPTSSDPNPTPASPQPGSANLTGIELPAAVGKDGKRRRVLIPGCGKGYDVVLFASHGYDAYGLEVSAHAAEAARKYIEEVRGDGEASKGPLEGEYSTAGKSHSHGSGTAKIILGDYFSDEWFTEVQGWKDGEGFDVVYDNTVSLERCFSSYLRSETYVGTVPLCSSADAPPSMGCSNCLTAPTCQRRQRQRRSHLSRVPYAQARRISRSPMVPPSHRPCRTAEAARTGCLVQRRRSCSSYRPARVQGRTRPSGTLHTEANTRRRCRQWRSPRQREHLAS